MKLVYCLLALSLLSLGVRAEEPNNTSSKEVMIDRVDLILKDVREIRKSLKNNEANEACQKVPAVVELYKAHLMDSGVRLELNKSRSQKVIHWAYEQLIYFHKLEVICGMGKDQEFVHMEDTIDELKDIIKSLKKQERKVKRSEAESHNSFSYKYDFHLNQSHE